MADEINPEYLRELEEMRERYRRQHHELEVQHADEFSALLLRYYPHLAPNKED